jgi:hypothetical protein
MDTRQARPLDSRNNNHKSPMMSVKAYVLPTFNLAINLATRRDALGQRQCTLEKTNT